MQEIFQNKIKSYTERICRAIGNSPCDKLEKVARALLDARKNGKWIFFAGNGGSAATASHFANDIVKGLSIPGKRRFKALALCDAVPIVTALANDYDYSLVFVEQLKNYSSPGDILVLISGSGNSPNVVNAARYGKESGLFIISFTGRDGGKLKELSDICCIAATDFMEEIEDVHLVWEHSLVTAIRIAVEKE